MFNGSLPAARMAALLLRAALLMMALVGLRAHAADEYLDPDKAFTFSARMSDPHTIAVSYVIADGYYMYRERFKFSAVGATLGEAKIPPGKVKFDETFSKNVETYRHAITISIPVQANGAFTLNASGQGCADAGLCYAPQDVSVQLVGAGGPATQPGGMSVAPGAMSPTLSSMRAPGAGVDTAPQAGAAANLASAAGNASANASVNGDGNGNGSVNAGAASATSNAATGAGAATSAPANGAAPSDLKGIAAVLGGGALLAIIPAFLVLGLGLSFTPCVLPMVPILSSIIVGEGVGITRSRSFALSVAYSLGMAIVYTVLGVAAALIGEGLAAALQNPWVLGSFGILIVAMAMSMFGFYELQLPGALQTSLVSASGRQSSGKLAGVFVMGALSALIVGPCVAAPLAGALLYISQTRNVVIGATALFSLAAGMSIPLLLVGLSAGSLLPRAGRWMDAVKRFFGVLMLAMALWLVSPVLPGAVQMLGWTALLLGYGCYLLRTTTHWAAMAAGVAFAVLGSLQLIGVASGGRDALAPLSHIGGGGEPQHGVQFTRVKTLAQLDAALASTGGKPAILDFYADWCVSCKEMEKLTFVDPDVKAKLAGAVLLQVDVTANDADDKAMLKRFKLFGPPGIILFDRAGKEIADSRVIGYQNAATFSRSLAVLH